MWLVVSPFAITVWVLAQNSAQPSVFPCPCAVVVTRSLAVLDVGCSDGYFAFEMEKRGAQRMGDSFVDDNVVHQGGFGSQGTASPKDPTRPGIFLYVMEIPEATMIDVWENVPKAR